MNKSTSTANAGSESEWSRYICLVIAVVAAIAAIIGVRSGTSWPQEVAFMTGIFVLAATLWVTEALPLFATSLLVIALEVLLLANPGGWAGLGFEAGGGPEFRQVLNAAADPVLLLFFGGFILAEAASKEGVDRALCSLILQPVEKRKELLLLAVMGATTGFSMWMSNTATAAMMMALIAPVIATVPPNDAFRKALILAVPVGANLGGLGTPIASPPNAVALGYLRKAGLDVGFLEWMIVAVPLLVILMLVAWLMLWRFYPPGAAQVQLGNLRQPLSHRGVYVVAIFCVTVLLWISDRWHGLPPSIVALLPAVGLTVPRVITRDDLGRIPWNVLILISGGIALGAGMQMTRLDALLVELLPPGITGTALVALLVCTTIIFGTFMSNTAIANLLLPIGISAGAASGGSVQAALSIALAASLSMSLPISTPPNAIAYASGEITTRDLARLGIVLGLVTAALLIAFGGIMMSVAGLPTGK